MSLKIVIIGLKVEQWKKIIPKKIKREFEEC
jgi:hypothetical protein